MVGSRGNVGLLGGNYSSISGYCVAGGGGGDSWISGSPHPRDVIHRDLKHGGDYSGISGYTFINTGAAGISGFPGSPVEAAGCLFDPGPPGSGRLGDFDDFEKEISILASVAGGSGPIYVFGGRAAISPVRAKMGIGHPRAMVGGPPIGSLSRTRHDSALSCIRNMR